MSEQVPGRVAAWEPPRRIVFDGGEDAGGLVFEWRVEAHDDGTCTVGLVNSGFGSGEGWDDQYDGMVEGWRLFLSNLQLHMEHFGGLTATPVLPMAMWAGPRTAAWATLATELGIPEEPAVGERIRTSGDAPLLAGTVVASESWRVTLLLDEPAPGTAFVAVEGDGDMVAVSVWSYLYGDAGTAAATATEPAWREWLNARAVAPES